MASDKENQICEISFYQDIIFISLEMRKLSTEPKVDCFVTSEQENYNLRWHNRSRYPLVYIMVILMYTTSPM